MKQVYLWLVAVPVLLLGAVTVLRAWLEVHHPEATVTDLVSANVLGLVWLVGAPAVMLKRGLSLWQAVLAGAVFLVGHRLFIGAVYALAWEGGWTVEGTDRPVRYVSQMTEQAPDASATQVFLGVTFVPVGFGLVMLLVVWSITWAAAFRGRPFARAVPTAG